MPTTKSRKKKKALKADVKTASGAVAAHVSDADGEVHGVGIWDLQVLLVKEGKFWIAQGLQIDYITQGETLEDAKKNFEEGLESTIDLNLRMYGNIDGLLVFAPNSVLQEAAKKKDSIKLYSQETLHEVGPKSQLALPFDGISYLVSQAA